MRLGHIDRFSIVLMPMCDIVSLKTDSRSNWPVAALMESSSILPCSSGILDVGSGEETRADLRAHWEDGLAAKLYYRPL